MARPWILIDIETLARNDTNAAVIAVAALNSAGDEFMGILGDVDWQLKHGAAFEFECFLWWLEQDAAWMLEPDLMHVTGKYIDQKITDLAAQAAHAAGAAAADVEMWTRGNDFDPQILGNYFVRRGLYPFQRDWYPTRHNNLHNIRTAALSVGQCPTKKTHDPLQDCKDDADIIKRYHALCDRETAKETHA